MKARLLGLILIVILLCNSAPLWANSAETLPRGVFVLGLKYGFKKAVKRFGPSFGTDTVKITNDYEVTIKGTDLNANMFEDTDIIGRTEVDYNSYGMEVTLTTAVGITDYLSAMFIVPFQYVNTRASIQLKDSNLYLVKDPNGDPYAIANKEAVDNTWSTMSGYTVSENVMNDTDLRQALACKADTPLCQFRMKRVGDFKRWGVSEVITGQRYKFHDTPKFRQAITLFQKWPTGRQVDTDNLLDSNFGDQQFDIGFWYGMDFVPIPVLTFNLTFGYTEQLPEIKEKRIWIPTFKDDGIQAGVIPLTPYWQKMKVHRDIGGNWDLYAGLGWNIFHWLNYSNEFYFFWKYKDNYWAAEAIPREPGTNAEWIPNFMAMEHGTNQAAIEMTNSIGINTIGWMQRGEFPIPLSFSVGYTVGLAGQNFEQNHTVWASLDLIGSIFMFEGSVEQSPDQEMDDIKLPGRTQNEDEKLDRAIAEEVKEKKRLNASKNYQNIFGKSPKYGW